MKKMPIGCTQHVKTLNDTISLSKEIYNFNTKLSKEPSGIIAPRLIGSCLLPFIQTVSYQSEGAMATFALTMEYWLEGGRW